MFTVALGPMPWMVTAWLRSRTRRLEVMRVPLCRIPHRDRRRADLYHFVHQVVRHAEVRIEGHVIIDVDASATR
jgi:hypothetical protein